MSRVGQGWTLYSVTCSLPFWAPGVPLRLTYHHLSAFRVGQQPHKLVTPMLRLPVPWGFCNLNGTAQKTMLVSKR